MVATAPHRDWHPARSGLGTSITSPPRAVPPRRRSRHEREIGVPAAASL